MSLNSHKTEAERYSEQKDETSTLSSQNTDSHQIHPRHGETANQPRFRANRLFSIGSAWYFSTREGSDQGPFITKEQAEIAVSEFIKKFR